MFKQNDDDYFSVMSIRLILYLKNIDVVAIFAIHIIYLHNSDVGHTDMFKIQTYRSS